MANKEMLEIKRKNQQGKITKNKIYFCNKRQMKIIQEFDDNF